MQTNAAEESEAPASIEMAAGSLLSDDVLQGLDTELYINNLWYLNSSKKPTCRLTGMTRFATFWVEGEKIGGPVSLMRFDESVLRMLGQNLLGLSSARETILSSDAYEARSLTSTRLPGELIDAFRLTF